MSHPTPEADNRTQEQIESDERIASEPHQPIPDIPPNTPRRKFEEVFPHRRPTATMGVVENGMIRLLDPAVHLTEQTRVIVVTSEVV